MSPRIVPPSVTGEPKTTGAFGAGAASDSTETVNHVERRPIAVRSFVAGTLTGVNGVTKLSCATRPLPSGVVVASVMPPVSFSAFAIVAEVTGTGPQSWYGEMSSYGSGTDTRYGSAVPVQAWLDSVFPPDVDEKNVVATVPL